MTRAPQQTFADHGRRLDTGDLDLITKSGSPTERTPSNIPENS
ncbi:hypothetical protein [Embleya sp. NPDC059237]